MFKRLQNFVKIGKNFKIPLYLELRSFKTPLYLVLSGPQNIINMVKKTLPLVPLGFPPQCRPSVPLSVPSQCPPQYPLM